MKIGIREIFSTERTKKQFVTTQFLFIGLPIIPIKSYFVFNKIIEIGSFPIPLNRKNIIKNYLSVYLSVLGFMMLIFNFFLNDNFLFSSHLNPFYYELNDLGIPLDITEKFITLLVVILSLYFIFYFGKISTEDKEERLLIQKSEFWKTSLPGKNLIPILGKFYNKEEQTTLVNQLIVLLFRIKLKLNDKEKNEIDYLSTQEKIEKFDNKLKEFILSEKYIEQDEKTIALLFTIVSIKRRINPSEKNERLHQKIKSHLLKITKPNKVYIS